MKLTTPLLLVEITEQNTKNGFVMRKAKLADKAAFESHVFTFAREQDFEGIEPGNDFDVTFFASPKGYDFSINVILTPLKDNQKGSVKLNIGNTKSNDL